MDKRLFWEDFAVAQTFPLGSYAVTREEVIAFAGQYDPQPYHLDETAAAANPAFGRLSASGIHTFSMVVRMTFDGHQAHNIYPIAGGGVDALRFHAPVYPGDTLSGVIEVVETRPLKSRPERGLVHFRTIGRNQDDVVVISYTALAFFARRSWEERPGN